jgi:hypothetical protein
MVYSEAKLNSVGDKVSLCFIVFTDTCIRQMFTYMDCGFLIGIFLLVLFFLWAYQTW